MNKTDEEYIKEAEDFFGCTTKNLTDDEKIQLGKDLNSGEVLN